MSRDDGVFEGEASLTVSTNGRRIACKREKKGATEFKTCLVPISTAGSNRQEKKNILLAA